MTTSRRRAILAALVGAFAQLAEAQKPKPKKEADPFHFGDIQIEEVPTTTALSLIINKVGGSDKITAINIVIDGETAEITPAELMDAVRPHKPKNNECPVCGVMAQPFYDLGPCLIGDGSTCLSRGPGGRSLEQVARCLHCNAAFWQDAE